MKAKVRHTKPLSTRSRISPALTSLVLTLFIALAMQAASADNATPITKENPVRGETSPVAGTGQQGFADGPGAQAQFAHPIGIAFDAANGDLYVADINNNRIRQITPDGTVSTFAGSGAQDSVDGTGTQAGFNHPTAIAWDPDNGNLYVVDTGSQKIRELTPQAVVRTLAGSGQQGRTDGPGAQATFSIPEGIAYDRADHALYVVDTNNNAIRKVTLDGVVSTLAGGTQGYLEGTGPAAQFSHPTDIAYDQVDGNLYVCDLGNGRIRRITPDGVVTTLSGTGQRGLVDGAVDTARFLEPIGIAFDSADGNLYVVELGTQRETMYGIVVRRALPGSVRRVSPATGSVTTIAGGQNVGYAEGVGSAAQFTFPAGITADSATGVLYVTDSYNHRIRAIK